MASLIAFAGPRGGTSPCRTKRVRGSVQGTAQKETRAGRTGSLRFQQTTPIARSLSVQLLASVTGEAPSIRTTC